MSTPPPFAKQYHAIFIVEDNVQWLAARVEADISVKIYRVTAIEDEYQHDLVLHITNADMLTAFISFLGGINGVRRAMNDTKPVAWFTVRSVSAVEIKKEEPE